MKRSSSRSAGSGRTVHNNTAAAIHDSARNTSAFTPESDSIKAEEEVPRHSVFHPSDDTPPGESQRFIKNNRYFTICIYGLIMLVASAIIFKAIIDIEKTKAWFGQIAGVLSPFIFGALLAYILNPMVRVFYHGMELLSKKFKFRLNKTVHKILAILITYVIVLGFAVLILVYILPEVMNNIVDFVNFIPGAYSSLLKLIADLQQKFPDLDIEAITKPITDAVPDLITTLRNFATNMVPAIYSVSMWIANWIVNLLITIIVSIYMLYDKKRLMRSCWKIIYAFLPQKHIPACHEILSECNRLFSSFVTGKFIDSAIIGVLCFILMTILQLPYTLFISVIVGVTNMIPYFGPFIGAVPGILILLFVQPVKALVFAIMVLCLQQFDGLILGPKILGESTGMKPLWIIFAITVGGSMFGVIGMFLGVPVVAILNYLLDLYLQFRLNKKNISEKAVDDAIKNMGLDD
ncbi:MAG: AI-2E family transporter [Lachnospiraceae bacterium]